MSYQCHLSGGKHTRIEKEIEIIPLQKIVTILLEDTLGISKTLSDYRVETTLQKLDHLSTNRTISHSLLLDDNHESQAPQHNCKRQDRPRYPGNIECDQSCDRGCLPWGIEVYVLLVFSQSLINEVIAELILARGTLLFC